MKTNFKGIHAPGGFEMATEELILLVERLVFDILMQEIRENGKGYIQNPGSLLHSGPGTLGQMGLNLRITTTSVRHRDQDGLKIRLIITLIALKPAMEKYKEVSHQKLHVLLFQY